MRRGPIPDPSHRWCIRKRRSQSPGRPRSWGSSHPGYCHNRCRTGPFPRPWPLRAGHTADRGRSGHTGAGRPQSWRASARKKQVLEQWICPAKVQASVHHSNPDVQGVVTRIHDVPSDTSVNQSDSTGQAAQDASCSSRVSTRCCDLGAPQLVHFAQHVIRVDRVLFIGWQDH